MKFTIEAKTLKDALAFVAGALESRSTIPVLSHILIDGGEKLTFTATDLDTTLQTSVDVQAQGSMCVQGRKLLDIVKTLDGDITLESDDQNWVKLSCGRAKFRIAGTNRENYPELPKLKETPIHLKDFSEMVKMTSFAITQEQSRFTLSGAKIEIADGKAKMIATDGHRLAYIEKDCEGTLSTLIPKKALTEAAKLSEVHIGTDANHIFFTDGNNVVISRTLSGQFPNYEMVLPKDNDKQVTFGDDLARAVKRISLMADDRNRSIKLHFKENEVEIAATSSEEGEGSETVPCDYSGEETIIGFNFQYLQEYLAIADTVTFSFKDSTTQTAFINDGYQYVVMPLRV